MGEARALAASARRRAARAQSSAAGQAEAMAILMRRTEMRTSAPTFKNLSRMVPQVASAKAVSARPMRRSAQISTEAIEANHSRNWLARMVAAEVRSA